MLNQDQTEILLKMLAATWRNFKIDMSTVAVWRDALSDVSPKAALAATRYLIKTFESDWPPKPSHVRSAALKFSAPPRKLAAELFPKGPGNASTPAERRAWDLWGGQRLWGTIPDPLRCGPELMPVYLSHSKRFAEIYNNLDQELTGRSAFIGRDEAKRCLDLLNFKPKEIGV